MSYFGLGALNASQAAHEKAKIHSAQATEKERLYIEAHYAWRVERDYPKAAGIYRQIARMFPKEKRAHYGLGEYYRRVGEYEQAIVAFEKTLQLDPNFGPGLNYAAYTYIKIGDLEINRERYTVSKKGTPVKLSATEFKLLLFLAERKGKVYSREQLLDSIWRDEAFVEPRTVDVHIRRLRAHIEDDPAHPIYIKTMRGIGYLFNGS